jgi:hypothetical protein
MPFQSEAQLESYLRTSLQEYFLEHDYPKVCLDAKGYTDLILTRTDVRAIFSIEVKWYKRQNNRIGIGNGSGEGVQLDLLRIEFPFMLHNVRWVIGSEDLDGVLFLTGEDVLNHVPGGVIHGQQNNISANVLMAHAPISLEEFPSQVNAWMDEL